MSLPFILDVAIGLVFIYLILSLLASELQELLTTLLQWRAKHLKDAIEVLLAGGADTPETEKVANLVRNLYEDPLLRNVNQETKGLIASSFRQVSRWLIPGNRKGAFGRGLTTGPSYIAPETFATSLMERLGLSVLVDKLTEVRLDKFAARIIGDYNVDKNGSVEILTDDTFQNDPDNWRRGGIRVIAGKAGKSLQEDASFESLTETYNDILNDFRAKQSTLETSVERMGESFDTYIASYPTPAEDDRASAYFVDRLKSFKLGIFGKGNERAIVSGGLRPSLFEIAELVNQVTDTHKEVAGAYEKLTIRGQFIDEQVKPLIDTYLRQYNQGLVRPATLDNLTNEQRQLFINDALDTLIKQRILNPEDRKIYDQYRTYQTVRQVLDRVPDSVKESLAVLARRAQSNVSQAGSELTQFRNEIATWFDRSMARASGVYKRNAKGVAILLGLILASSTNSDTFFIADRLSNDENLRKVITDKAAQIVPNQGNTSPTTEDLEALKNKTNSVLQGLSLPVGWEASNMIQQFGCPVPSTPLGTSAWTQLYTSCLPGQPTTGKEFAPQKVVEIATKHPIPFLRMFIGWIVSGIAIAMGAPFWFDLLGKIMNVRNSGNKPATEGKETAK